MRVFGVLLLVLASPLAWAQVDTNRIDAVKSLQLEDLLHAEVSSVSKRVEDSFTAPAAIYVITGEDIRRSGATSIPEALRLAPGLSVAQLNASTWAITARGFNDRFADKLLVLIDGRSVYSPSTSGVFWDVQNYPLEDIDRIEVIRGPGGTLWGANAVNGVINIITKSAKDTLGGYASAGYGSAIPGFGNFRYGWRLGDDEFLRAYMQYFDRAPYEGGQDGWDSLQGGFRFDADQLANELTLQGDYYYNVLEEQQVIPTFVAPYSEIFDNHFRAEGGNLLFRFDHQPDADSDIQLQTYIDYTERSELVFAGNREIMDVDFQHRFALPLNQSFMYGFQYNYSPDHFQNPDTNFVAWNPANRNLQVFSGFVQDVIGIVPDTLNLTAGSKLEHNDFTGWEYEPNVRLAWLVSPRQTLWAAVSRADQVPERNVNDIFTLISRIPSSSGLPVYEAGVGNENINSQNVVAYELGYRAQPVDQFAFDIATFCNSYSDLITGVAGTPYLVTSPVPHIILPIQAVNGGAGTTYGAEISSEWRPVNDIRLQANYSYLYMSLDQAAETLFTEGKDPHNQFSLHSSFDLPAHLQLDLIGRYTDELPAFGIGSVFDCDARLAWKPWKGLEISVVGQNLLHDDRIEFGSSTYTRTIVTPVPRGVYGQVSVWF